jgi:hypothetical protein
VIVFPKKSEFEQPALLDAAIDCIGYGDERSKICKLYGYATGRLTRYTVGDLDQCLSRFGGIRLVVMDGSLVGGSFAEFFRMRGISVVTLHHNVESEYHLDSKTPVSLWGTCAKHINRCEKIAVELSDLNLTITQEDAETLVRLHPKCGRISCLGVFEPQSNPGQLESQADDEAEVIVCAITGSMGAYQTHDGVMYFLKTLYPLIEAEFPQVKFILAGRSPRKELYDHCRGRKNVEIVANPANMQDVIRRANLYLCPTRLGGGLKLRVMDGLKAGLPVLAHKVSARGYQGMAEKGYLHSFETADQFAAGFREMVKKFRDNGYSRSDIRKSYDEVFSFEQGTRRLSEMLRSAGFL